MHSLTAEQEYVWSYSALKFFSHSSYWDVYSDELQLREIIKEISDQIEEILEPHSYPINNYQNLSELVDQLNWEIKEKYFELIEKYLQGSLDFIVVQKRYESILHIAEKFVCDIQGFK